MSGEWREVRPSSPCPACGSPDWCAWAPDGNLKCERSAEPPAGFALVARKDGGAVFRHEDAQSSQRGALATPAPLIDRTKFAGLAQKFSAALPESALNMLAAELGVTAESLECVGIGWAAQDDLLVVGAWGDGWGAYPDGAYAFPERDGKGALVGFSFRASGGRKGSASGKACGARRGLIIPAALGNSPDPVLIVEGPSDVAACRSMGLTAVGRPNNSGGVQDLSALLLGRAAIVVGERDQKPDGRWPGRDGAVGVASKLAEAWRTDDVSWSLPPEGAKDVRAWLQERVRAGLDLADRAAARAAGAELLASLRSAQRRAASGNSIRAPIENAPARNAWDPLPISALGPSVPPTWLWPCYIAAEHITLFCGMWKSGKTTLISWLLHDMILGGGLVPDPPSLKVLVITEEGQTLWCRRRDELGLTDAVEVLARPFIKKASHSEWQEFVMVIAALVAERGYGLVVIDTLPSIWPVVNENDAAEVGAAMMPLHAITARGAAILLTHHPRKSGGDEGQLSRGSGALPGFADIIVEFRRFAAQESKDRRRILTAYSRFEETPSETVIELGDTGYTIVGDRGTVNQSDRLGIIFDVLPSEGPGITDVALGELWPTKPAPGKRSLQLDLAVGAEKGRWERLGAGKKNDPFRYRRGPECDSRSTHLIGARIESEPLAAPAHPPDAGDWGRI